MGDKNPKQKQKTQKQDTAQKKREKDAHDRKQAPPPQAKK